MEDMTFVPHPRSFHSCSFCLEGMYKQMTVEISVSFICYFSLVTVLCQTLAKGRHAPGSSGDCDLVGWGRDT